MPMPMPMPMGAPMQQMPMPMGSGISNIGESKPSTFSSGKKVPHKKKEKKLGAAKGSAKSLMPSSQMIHLKKKDTGK